MAALTKTYSRRASHAPSTRQMIEEFAVGSSDGSDALGGRVRSSSSATGDKYVAVGVGSAASEGALTHPAVAQSTNDGNGVASVAGSSGFSTVGMTTRPIAASTSSIQAAGNLALKVTY